MSRAWIVLAALALNTAQARDLDREPWAGRWRRDWEAARRASLESGRVLVLYVTLAEPDEACDEWEAVLGDPRFNQGNVKAICAAHVLGDPERDRIAEVFQSASERAPRVLLWAPEPRATPRPYDGPQAVEALQRAHTDLFGQWLLQRRARRAAETPWYDGLWERVGGGLRDLGVGVLIFYASLSLLFGVVWVCGGWAGFMGWAVGGVVGLAGGGLAVGLGRWAVGEQQAPWVGGVGLLLSTLLGGACGRVWVRGWFSEQPWTLGQAMGEGVRLGLLELGAQLCGSVVGAAAGAAIGGGLGLGFGAWAEWAGAGAGLGAVVGFVAGWSWANRRPDEVEDPFAGG